MTNRRNLILAGLAAASIAGGAACAPAIGSPALQGLAHPRPTWTNANGPTIFLTPDAAERGKPWCGSFLLTTTGAELPCDPGVFTHVVNGVTITVRTRWDVDLSPLARGLSADDPSLSRMGAECDDAGGEMIVHVTAERIIAAAECEDTDY